MFDIHFCKESEIDQVMQFIDQYWSKDHVLSSSRSFMQWQYYNAVAKRYNFVVGSNTETDEILGILGYVPTTHFDPALESQKIIWLALWKVREDIKVAGLGLSLLSFLTKQETYLGIGVSGLRENSMAICKMLGYQVGEFNQFYMLNRSKKQFKLVGNPFHIEDPTPIHIDSEKKLLSINKQDFAAFSEKFEYRSPEIDIPEKSCTYFFYRYLAHPVYSYELFSISEKGSSLGLIATRRVSHQGSHALRIVDYLGSKNTLQGMYGSFQKLLEQYDAEYIDFLNHGMDDEFFEAAGFRKRLSSDEIVIPNYYEPFEKKNIRILFAYRADRGLNYLTFKGDGDQDRPNRLHEGSSI